MLIYYRISFVNLIIQSAKILLLPPKCEIIRVSSNHSFFQYCESNIGLFSIASHLVIALPTLQQQKLWLLILLLQFLYNFCRLVYGFFSILLLIQLSLFQLLRQFSLFYALKGIAKSNGNLFAIAFKSKKERQQSPSRQLEERERAQNLYQKVCKRIMRNYEAIQKSPMNDWMAT